VRPLPAAAQVAPSTACSSGDWDGDGRLDALAAGNSHATDTQTGWHDAGTGAVLLGDGRGGFAVRRGARSGFFVDGDARAVAALERGAAGPLVLVTQTGDSLRAFAPRARPGPRGAPAAGGGWVAPLAPLDAVAEVTLAGGAVRREELAYGAGYLTQGARRLRVPPGAARVVVRDSRGRARELAPPPGAGAPAPRAPRGRAAAPRLAQR
jgi:hypothetical protein